MNTPLSFTYLEQDKKFVKQQEPSSSDDSSSEAESPVKPTKKAAAPAKATKSKKAKATEELSDDSSDSEEVEIVAKSKKGAKAATTKKAKAESSDDDSSSEDAAPAKPAKKAAAKKAESSDEDSSSEDAAPAKKAAAKADSSDDEESSEDAAPAKKAAAKADSSSDDEEDANMEGEDEEEQKTDAKPAQAAASSEDEIKEIVVANLSWNVDDDLLYNTFAEIGTVEKANVLVRNGRSEGIGFVTFSTREEAQTAVDQMSEQELDGRNMRIRFSTPRNPNGNQRETNPDAEGSHTIFIGNVGYNTTKDTLWDFFAQYGTVSDLRVATDQEGNPRGFAHCEFATPEEAKASVEANGEYVDGRALRIDLSAPRNRDGGSRGGRGGRGGFGGGRGGSRGGFGGGRGGSRGGRGGFNRPSAARGTISEFKGSKMKF